MRWLTCLVMGLIVMGSYTVMPTTQLDGVLEQLSAKRRRSSFAQASILRDIQIKGLVHVDAETILNELPVFKGDAITPYGIDNHLKRIQALGLFYSVDSQLEPYDGGKRWVITVVENPIIQDIAITGNTAIPTSDILSVLSSQKGTLFDYTRVRHDMDAINELYTNRDFILMDIKRVDPPTFSDPVLRFALQEGRFNAIVVSGNTKTRRHVITRELDIQPGDVTRPSAIRRNLARVYNLNYFSEVVPDVVPATDATYPNAYDLHINVVEKSTSSVNFGGGWGQQSGGFLYSDLNIDNVLGTGQLVALRGQWGGNLQTYQFKYHNPWMFGPRRSLTYRAWNTRGNFGYNNTAFSSGGYRPEIRYGMDLAVGYPYTYQWRSSHRIKVEDVHVDAYAGKNAFNYSIYSYTHTLSYDTRDVAFNPLNGIYGVLTVENTFPVQANAMVFTKYDLDIAHFYQTAEKQTVATRVLVGRINGAVQSTEYYYVGGPNTVRGYVPYPNAFAHGKIQLVTNIEYRFLINDVFQFLFFVDAGWASSLGPDIRKAKIGKGLGFRINSPLGPIRIDMGIDEKQDMRTHLNIGHVF